MQKKSAKYLHMSKICCTFALDSQRRSLDKAAAEALKKALEEVGATVELK